MIMTMHRLLLKSTKQRAILFNNIRGLQAMTTGPVAAAIQTKLQQTFAPSHLDVINESHMHNVPKNSETHFKVVVVSEKFDSVKSLVQRHRLVNHALEEELKGPVHALSIVAKSPEQWQTMQEKGEKIAASPKCRGGDGSLQ